MCNVQARSRDSYGNDSGAIVCWPGLGPLCSRIWRIEEERKTSECAQLDTTLGREPAEGD
jgi:hypothetical protein